MTASVELEDDKDTTVRRSARYCATRAPKGRSFSRIQLPNLGSRHRSKGAKLLCAVPGLHAVTSVSEVTKLVLSQQD